MEMDGFVGKPIRRRDFLATVERIAGAPRVNGGAERDETSPEERAILDRSTLMSIVGGNRELIAELVDLYWQSLPKQMANIRGALDEGNADQCQYWAHALKGMSLNLSARQTADIALEMELMGKGGDLSAGEALWQRLSAAVDRLRRTTDGMLEDLGLTARR
jgi:HPt (histidine-containing phosphotransfer) domain-containing protein